MISVDLTHYFLVFIGWIFIMYMYVVWILSMKIMKRNYIMCDLVIVYYNCRSKWLLGKMNSVLMIFYFNFCVFRDKGLCIVIDPPFGGRVEPLVQTIKELSAEYRKLCDGEGLLPVIWAFPYFSEPYIQNLAPEIKMHDYRVSFPKIPLLSLS